MESTLQFNITYSKLRTQTKFKTHNTLHWRQVNQRRKNRIHLMESMTNLFKLYKKSFVFLSFFLIFFFKRFNQLEFTIIFQLNRLKKLKIIWIVHILHRRMEIDRDDSKRRNEKKLTYMTSEWSDLIWSTRLCYWLKYMHEQEHKDIC